MRRGGSRVRNTNMGRSIGEGKNKNMDKDRWISSDKGRNRLNEIFY